VPFAIESGRPPGRWLVTANTEPFVGPRGWQLIAEYEDDGRSAGTGKLDKRTGFAPLLAGVRARRFQAVMVGDLDRITRAGDLAWMQAARMV
jgi:DNA invertase Pin-like site-specific DNA recombinase